MRITIALGLLLLLPSSALAVEPIDFSHDVLPLLQSACAKCHTNGTYKGSFSLDTRESLLESGMVEVGKSGESDLIERLTTEDPELRMPLEQDPLTPEQVALFRRWIDQGLPWEEGFSFQQSTYELPLAPRRPEVPPASQQVSNPVDRILQPYYESHAVSLEPVTDAAFARRVSLDLIGLLPKPEQLAAFLNDTSPDRREQYVSALLSQNREYAEHWLTFWNDALRNDYAGVGYIEGGRKQITGWLYQSLVENKPFDQFVRELINPSPESEGFINGIKWRGRVNASQVREIQFAQNISQVFLGLNMKCASCHDSFINRWKLKDAYSLAAIVASEPIEIHRCDKPTGELATAAFLYPELGSIDPAAPREERLRQLGELLTHPENGRFTRTIVNRIWQRLMGRGLVHPVDEMDNPPWNADLLDFLAVDLVDHQYDLKHTVQLIATSQAYQAHCEIISEEALNAKEYVFRGPLTRRMTAEQFFDAVWMLTNSAPAEAAAPVGDRGEQPVRAALVNSSLLMRSLGRPNREQIVTTRPAVLSTLQSLDLSNGEEFHSLLLRGAENLLAQWNAQAEPMIQYVYQTALARLPAADEMTASLSILGDEPTAESIADLLWVVFMLPEFQMIR
ncbi:MAG: PSD1 domain-containing protein [Planctomycetales bacterium]|nr:PSD1 domain-containing protein [Planctomycetales bacterium]